MGPAFSHDNPCAVIIQIRNNLSEIIEKRVVPIGIRYIAKKNLPGLWHAEVVDLDDNLTFLVPMGDIVKWGTYV